jgi:hypothetical protein
MSSYFAYVVISCNQKSGEEQKIGRSLGPGVFKFLVTVILSSLSQLANSSLKGYILWRVLDVLILLVKPTTLCCCENKEILIQLIFNQNIPVTLWEQNSKGYFVTIRDELVTAITNFYKKLAPITTMTVNTIIHEGHARL